MGFNERKAIYFGDSGQLANRTDGTIWINDRYNSARRVRDIAGSASWWWWLRSPGWSPFYAAIVHPSGTLGMFGSIVYQSEVVGVGIRPALWLYR